MKQLLISVLILSIGSKQLKAQNNAAAIAAGASLLATGITVAALVEQYKELLELGATEYILANQRDISDFKLSILDFEGVKITDLSNMTCLTFSIEKIDQRDNKTGEKYILFMFTSKGWVNDLGINYSLV